MDATMNRYTLFGKMARVTKKLIEIEKEVSQLTSDMIDLAMDYNDAVEFETVEERIAYVRYRKVMMELMNPLNAYVLDSMFNSKMKGKCIDDLRKNLDLLS